VYYLPPPKEATVWFNRTKEIKLEKATFESVIVKAPDRKRAVILVLQAALWIFQLQKT